MTTKAEQRTWQEGFLELLPAIEQHARVAFCDCDPEAREEAVQEVIANALVAYVRLVEQDKEGIAFASPLARFAVAQVRDGRTIAGRLNVRDVLAPYAQRRKHFHVDRLDRFDQEENQWLEILVEDKTVTPAELAASRIDYPAFLASLPERDRKIAETLATGESTREVAKQFDLSSGRISQLRIELRDAWLRFHGEQANAA